MTSQGIAVPAWQTDDLADEWVEEEDEEDEAADGEPHGSEQPPTQTMQSTFNARGTCNFGTTNIDARNTSQESEPTAGVGTFLVHSDMPAADLPQTPGVRKKKGGIKDIFSPLQLERMFDPPSPPKSTSPHTSTPQQRLIGPPSRHRSTSRPVKPSKLSQVYGASALAEESEAGHGAAYQDEILETDMPNIAAFGEARPSPTCRFTFSVPCSVPRFPARVNFGTPDVTFPIPNDNDKHSLQVQKTPFPSSRSQRLTDQQHTPNDSRLRLFQFQYDTYTREHLSAIVDSFGISSPSNISSSKQSMGTILHDLPAEQQDEPNHEFPLERAAKRLKLTPPSEFTPDGPHRDVQGPIQHQITKRDYIGESQSFMQQIRRARDLSFMSATESPEQDAGCPLVTSDRTNTHAQAQETHPENVASSSSPSTGSKANAFGSKYTAMAYRKQAAELMAKIKGDPRLVSGKGDNSILSQRSEEDVPNVRDRSCGPSPESRPRSPVKRRLEDKENQSDMDPDPDPPSYAASIALNRRQFNEEFNTKVQPPQRHFPAANQNARGVVIMPVAIPEIVSPIADRVRSPNPTFLAPPPTAFGSMRFAAQMRTTSTNEDLNRLVSSGSTVTTATTLTAGSAGSGVKHAGPAQMVRIAPGDLPSIPERVGGMVFDRTLGRWVKERGSSDRTIVRSCSQGASALGSPIGPEGFTESEDPFRDIESLRDGESGHSPPAGDAADIILVPIDYNQDGTDGTDEMHVVSSDTDSDFDDEEDAQISMFSFDQPPPGTVQAMAGDDDDVTDSDADNAISDTETEGEPEPVDREFEGKENEDLSKELASMSIHDDQPQFVEEGISMFAAPGAGAGLIRKGLVNFSPDPIVAATPCKVPRPTMQPPRSALKSASVTPISKTATGRGRSVSFSDGRKDGKIVGLHAGRDREEVVLRTPGVPISDSLQSVPSVRSKRIMEMLEDMEESLLDDEDQSIGHQHRQTVPSNNGQGSADMSVASPRSFMRSPTIRRQGQSSPRRVNTPSRVNATFLTECSFGVAHDRLVEVITDVQPFEPYWESLSSVNLAGRKLDSVARLKEFLPKLDSLNLNNNLLSWLSGIPSTVRTLSVASNALTRLTSFGHLSNLENLDISYNDINSLQQLECLRHLRELRADGNKVSSLDGLELFDGLLKLSLEGNRLHEIDLTGLRWSRLELLNLSNNRLESVRGLYEAPSLISINLDNNLLAALDQLDYSSEQDRGSAANASFMQKLRILRLSGNRLKRLDVTRFPNLRTLYVDNNCLADGRACQRGQAQKTTRQRLIGLRRLCKLENFSARNQSAPGMRDSGLRLQSNDVRDVKRLYLSGNPYPIPLGIDAQACYNLVYLELAACRLTTLPANFSSIMPNIRALNLNYNFLETDEVARGLVGLRRLRKLTIVGNRMTGTKALVKMLNTMGQNIEMLDFRMNPCTLVWYLPLIVQDKDNGALLQPSEPPSGKHHSPFAMVLPTTSKNPEEGNDFRGTRDEGTTTVPSSKPRTGGSGTRTSDSNANGLAKNKERHNPSHWEALDAQFRRGLPDKAYAGRLAYRGLIMRACPQIKILDGVRTTEKERRKAEALLKRVLKEAEVKGTIRRVLEDR